MLKLATVLPLLLTVPVHSQLDEEGRLSARPSVEARLVAEAKPVPGATGAIVEGVLWVCAPGGAPPTDCIRIEGLDGGGNSSIESGSSGTFQLLDVSGHNGVLVQGGWYAEPTGKIFGAEASDGGLGPFLFEDGAPGSIAHVGRSGDPLTGVVWGDAGEVLFQSQGTPHVRVRPGSVSLGPDGSDCEFLGRLSFTPAAAQCDFYYNTNPPGAFCVKSSTGWDKLGSGNC